MLTLNGLLLNVTTDLGLWQQDVKWYHTDQFINITKIDPSGQEIHVCWLVVPGEDFH